MAANILDTTEWELHFVGKDIPNLTLGMGIVPHRHENLGWKAYADLVRTMDLGLSLMATPHPSYPPLDLAASGAVVVTSRFGRKSCLDQYSQNIICVDPSVDGLLHGLERGIRLARDAEQRAANYRRNSMLRDWRTSFASVLDRVADGLRDPVGTGRGPRVGEGASYAADGQELPGEDPLRARQSRACTSAPRLQVVLEGPAPGTIAADLRTAVVVHGWCRPAAGRVRRLCLRVNERIVLVRTRPAPDAATRSAKVRSLTSAGDWTEFWTVVSVDADCVSRRLYLRAELESREVLEQPLSEPWLSAVEVAEGRIHLSSTDGLIE